MKRRYIALWLFTSISSFAQTENLNLTDSLKTAQQSDFLDEELKEPAWQFSFAIGLNVGHNLELNAPNGFNTRSFTTTNSLDLGINYLKDNSSFQMTNEFHYMLGLQKDGIQSNDYIKRTLDDLSSLHDFSFSTKKNKKWNINLIAKVSTSSLTIYDGNYLKDYNSTGRVQGFWNPYDITFSPGIKYLPNKYFRISISPFSGQLFGLKSQKIANTGLYTEEGDGGNYIKTLRTPLGADLNVWYDRKIKNWLQMQYRAGVSSNYFKDITTNGLLNGLFITKVKLFADVYLMHRGVLKGNIVNRPIAANYQQTILLSFSKSF
jgi:hypothetical protein